MVITTPPVMRMLRKTQPRTSVKSPYFGGLLYSMSMRASIWLPVNRVEENAELILSTPCQASAVCALPHIVTKSGAARLQALEPGHVIEALFSIEGRLLACASPHGLTNDHCVYFHCAGC